MKHCISLFMLHFIAFSGWGEPRLTVYQHCGRQEITVFYKDGTEGATGKKLNDTCIIYDVPISEPLEVAILIGDDNRHIKRIWMAPGYPDRVITIDNCTGQLIKHDTLSFDRDDAPFDKLFTEAQDGKITEAAYDTSLDSFFENYIMAHPDSFLAVHYLDLIKNKLSTDKLAKYKERVGRMNNKYSAMRDIEVYMANYKYKSVPRIGDPFMEFQTQDVGGNAFDSKTISAKVLVMYFCYSGCGPCARAAGPMTRLYEKYKSSGLEVLTFSLDKTKEDWRQSVTVHKYPGINVSDLIGFNSPLSLHYAVDAFPYFVVFDQNKKIAMVTSGADDVITVENKVKELLGK